MLTLAGRFRPGERILERLLVEQLKVSRTPIREALQRLETEGLIVCVSRRSYNVRALTIRDVREGYETLSILAGAAAGQIVSRIDTQDLKELKRLHAEMRDAARRTDLRAFGHLAYRFHEVLLATLENRTLRELCNVARGRLYAVPVSRQSLDTWLKMSLSEHSQIIRLVGARDGDALRAYFRNVYWSYERHRRYIEVAHILDESVHH